MLYIAPQLVLGGNADDLRHPVFLWDNKVTFGGITADHEEPRFPATNLANPQTWSRWKSSMPGAQEILFDLQSDTPINSLGIARHNLGSAQIGLEIYGITADEGATFQLLAELAPGDDSPILALFTPGYYVQIKLVMGEGAEEADPPRAAVIYIGSALIMPRGTPAGLVLLKDGLERTTLSSLSENGEFLGDVVTSERLSTSPRFEQLERQWYLDNMRPFLQTRDPFFYSWSPALRPTETGYAKFGQPPQGTLNAADRYDVTLSMTGLAL